MVNVCAHYCGTTILIDSFNTVAEAEDFMKNGFVMYQHDENETEDDDYYVYPDEMFIEDEIPFFEQMNDRRTIEDILSYECLDGLPF